MKAKTAIAMLMCLSSICANADNQDILIRYDKNSYLKNLVITPEIDADLKANKETLLYVVKRKERNYQKICSDSLATIMARIEAIENDMRNIERLKGLQGQKYSSDADRELVGRQIALYVVPAEKIESARNAYNQAKVNTFSGISSALKAAKQETSLNNLQKNAQKELDKNKIGENTVSVLSDRLVALESDKAACNRTKEVLENWQQQELTNLKGLIWFDPDAIDEYFVCSDTIVNPYHPTLVMDKIKSRFTQDPKGFAYLVNLTYDKEWEWVLKEARASMHEDFPRKMDYYRYESHPDLRVMDYYNQRNVYDKNGNIVAVVNPEDLGLTVDADIASRDGIGTLVARFAYENNDHDIQSYDAKTLHYVKALIGLEELTAKEKAEREALLNKLANASANYILDDMKYGSNTKKGRAAQEKNAVDFLGAMLSANSVSYYSSTGQNWFDQIKRDYTDNVYIIERERIDGVTFRSVYADNNANPLFEITVRYEADKDYHRKKVVEFKKCRKTDQMEQAIVQKMYETGIVDQVIKGEGADVIGRREVKNAEYVFDAVDKMPSFPGGQDAMMSWLSSNIKYPVVAEENGVQGNVVCSVVVEPDGSITDVKVMNGVDPSLDKEAIRVIKQMPKWTPGKLNGSAVRVKCTVPVTFRLQ